MSINITWMIVGVFALVIFTPILIVLFCKSSNSPETDISERQDSECRETSTEQNYIIDRYPEEKVDLRVILDYLLRWRSRDEFSGIEFLEIKIDFAEFTAALSSLACRPVDLEVRGLEYLGKKAIKEELIVEMPYRYSYQGRKQIAYELAKKKQAKEGWEVDNYFGSKNSFFSDAGKEYARTYQFTYVDVDHFNDLAT